MRKIQLIVCVMILLSVVLPAAANPIFIDEPLDKYDIRSEHRDIQIYAAAGENGQIAAYEDIPPAEPLNYFPNGTEFILRYFKCIEDECWAVVNNVCFPGEDEFHRYYGKFDMNRYISANDLIPAYDFDAFIEQHSDEILPFEESIDFCSLVPFDLWKYPNSGSKLTFFDSSNYSIFTKCEEEQKLRERYHVDRVYIDEDGDRWITFDDNTMFGIGSGWVNIGPGADNAGK